MVKFTIKEFLKTLCLGILIVFFSCNNSQENLESQTKSSIEEELKEIVQEDNHKDTLIQTIEDKQTSLKKATNSVVNTSKPLTLKEQLQETWQSFKIKNESTFIEGKFGTKIFIPKNAFKNYEDLVIELKEVYTPSSILFQNLSTQTPDGKIIETAGMINIRAVSDGKEVELIKGKKLVIHFPKGSSKYNDYMLFNGESNKEDSLVKWTSDADATKDYYLSRLTLSNDGSLAIYGQNDSLKFLSRKEYQTLQRFLKRTLRKEFIYKFEFDKDNTYKLINSDFDNDTVMLKIYTKILEETGIDKSKQIFKKSNNNLFRSYLFFSNDDPMKSYEEYYKKFVSTYGEGSKEKASSLELKYFVFSTTNLNWINCDRFLKDEREKTTMFITYSESNYDFMLYFKNSNVTIKADFDQTKYSIKGIPKKSEAILIALKYQDGKIYLANKPLKVNSKPIHNLSFKEVGVEDVKKEIDQIVNQNTKFKLLN